MGDLKVNIHSDDILVLKRGKEISIFHLTPENMDFAMKLIDVVCRAFPDKTPKGEA